MKTVPHRIDPDEVASTIVCLFQELFPGASSRLIRRLLAAVRSIFSGHYLNYQPSDLGYHDFTHTLQVAQCFVRIFEGRHTTGAVPKLTVRDFEIGLTAVLLHDSGYLRLQADEQGSGAKYTHVHVLRSGAFAASFAPSLGFTASESNVIAETIFCTGIYNRINTQHFTRHENMVLAAMLVTADFLGQMAAPDYPSKLDTLYSEFKESDDYYSQPASKRIYQSADELRLRTPAFWRELVKPMLDRDLLGVYRYLADPYPNGSNAYIDAIEHNIRLIELGHPVQA